MAKVEHISILDLHRRIQSLERELSKIEDNIKESKDKGFCDNLLKAIRTKDIESIESLKRDFERISKKSYRKYSKSMKYL